MSQERNIHRSSTFYKQNQSKTVLMREDNSGWAFFSGEALLWIMDNGLKQWSSNLILEGRCPAEFSSNLPQHTQGRRYGFWAPWTAYSLGPSCGGGVIYYRNRDCISEPVFFSPSPKSDYTVSAIKIVQFCM